MKPSIYIETTLLSENSDKTEASMMKYEDSIIAEVRETRIKLLADFDGDGRKLNEHLRSQQPIMEAAGAHYETEEERQARFVWNKQQEAVDRRVISQ